MEGAAPKGLYEPLVRLHQPVFGELWQHPKLLPTLVPVLAHLVTERQILAVADIQQLADYFGPLRVPAKGLASHLEYPERPHKPASRPMPLQQPAGR